MTRMQQLIARRFADLQRREGAHDTTPEMREQLRALGYVAN